jgi:DNA-directed RNA polymerase subunit RPC12/RpoP
MPKEDETNKKRTTSSSTARGKGTKKGKDGWKCTICTNKFTKDDDKVVQCEHCNLYYCSECLTISDEEYQGFNNPSLHWYCPNCESKVIANLRIDQEIEVRCNEYFKIIDSRVTKIEKVLNEKPSVVQVESMIADAIKSNDKGESKQICDDDVVASINCKVSDIRESAERKKTL